jgi:predicted tellurium resistance membrane protein TerC
MASELSLIFVKNRGGTLDISTQFHELLSIHGLVTVVTLTLLEIILGIDNIIFISIAANKLEKSKRKQARAVGLTMALVIRSVLLFFASYLASLKTPFFEIWGFQVSGSDLVFLSGGLFLLIKTILELKAQIYGEDNQEEKELGKSGIGASFTTIILQIMLIDIVFSFDSILAAVSLAQDQTIIMIAAVTVSMLIMLAFSGAVSDFIHRYENVKTLALLFLLVISFILIADGLHIHIDKAYMYVALFFALAVEGTNIWRKRIAMKRIKDLK